MSPKEHLEPLAVVPAPRYPVPLLWRRGAVRARVRDLVAACSAGLCIAGCGAPTAAGDGANEAPAALATDADAPSACPGPGDATAGSVAIAFEDRMGSAYRLTRAAFALDGEPVFERDLDGESDAEQPRDLAVLEERLAEGVHHLAVHLEFRGVPFGVGYIRGITFRVASSHDFVIGARRRARLVVTAYERGGVTTPMEERPAVGYELRDLGCE